jgi:hypothetical protein
LQRTPVTIFWLLTETVDSFDFGVTVTQAAFKTSLMSVKAILQQLPTTYLC